jgi:hypothetical protein
MAGEVTSVGLCEQHVSDGISQFPDLAQMTQGSLRGRIARNLGGHPCCQGRIVDEKLDLSRTDHPDCVR